MTQKLWLIVWLPRALVLFQSHCKEAVKAFDAEAIEPAVKVHVRHKQHTHYDQLLIKEWGRTETRSAIAEKLGHIVSKWSRKPPNKLPKA
jgi:hypothetical protein